jgi:hypothetical protein
MSLTTDHRTDEAWPLAGRRGAVLPLIVIGFVFSAAAIAFFAVFVVKKGIIPDLHWILRSGQYILSERRLPATDIFSWSMGDKPVLLYQWLFMALTAAAEQLLGMHGLLVLFIAAAIAIYFAAPLFGAVPRRVPAIFVILVAGLGMTIVTVNMALRPMIATSALLLAQYVIIQRWRRGLMGSWLVAPLIAVVYLLWANLHNGVALGVGSLLLFALGDFAERRRIYPFEPVDCEIEGSPQRLRSYLLLVLVVMFASLGNPYGYGTYTHLADYTSTKFLVDIINETQSPNFRFPQFAWFLVLLVGLFAIMTRATRAVAAADLLHLAAFSVATFSIQRIVIWAVLLYVLILPRAMHHLWTASPAQRSLGLAIRRSSAPVRTAAAVAAAGVIGGLALWMSVSPPVLSDRCEDVRGAIASYGQSRRPTDRLFNTALVGSCTIAVDGRPLVFFDTRYDFYGADFSKRVIDTQSLSPGWRAQLDAWRIDTLIVEKKRALAQALAVDPDFAVVYEDDGAIVARRIAPAPTASNRPSLSDRRGDYRTADR